jgi:hypothetical protein
MNPARLFLSLSVLGASLIAACSSSSDSGGGASDAAAFTSSLADIVCNAYKPCCEKAGLPTDGAQCRAFYTAFGGLQKGTYDPAAGQACLDAARTGVQQSDICSSSGSTLGSADAVCNKVFKTATTQTKNPGEACTDDSDCIPGSEGTVECHSCFAIL